MADLNRSRLPVRRGQTAVSSPTDVSELRRKLVELDFKKANASTVGGLSTAIGHLQDTVSGKADAVTDDGQHRKPD